MISDSDLLESIRDDDKKAFSILFYRYSSAMYGKSYAYIRDAEVCEQIVHDVFLTIWSNRKTLQILSVKGYLTAAARYRVYKHLNAAKIVPIDYKENLEVLDGFLVENTGYDDLAYKDLEVEVDSYLAALPKKCREIFLMSRKQTLSNEEIAIKLGISKRTVENQITHALKHLRLSLKHIMIWVLILTSL